MKYNTLRQYWDYNLNTGCIQDRRLFNKTGRSELLGNPIPLSNGIQKQFPHLKPAPCFYDMNRNLKRKRYKKWVWLPDLIHFLYRRFPPTGPLVFQSERRWEYEIAMRQAELDYFKDTGQAEYDSLLDLRPYLIGFDKYSDSPRYRAEDITWFRPVHPYIYWHWRNQSWVLNISHNGKKTTGSYAFDDYIGAVEDLIEIKRRIRGLKPDQIPSDPELSQYQTDLFRVLPRSQSTRATANGLRRPETRIEALWRFADEQRLQDEMRAGEKHVADYNPLLDHEVSALRNRLLEDDIPLEDL